MKPFRFVLGLALLLGGIPNFGQDFYDGAALEPASAPGYPEAEGYIRSIAGNDPISPFQKRGLLDLFMEERGLDPDSPPGRDLIARFFPEEAARQDQSVSALDPRFRRFGSLFLSIAGRYETTPGHIEELVRRNGLENVMAGMRDKRAAENILRNLLLKAHVEAFAERYPATTQGLALRELGNHLTAKSGKSAEEIARSGAFFYADFSGLSVVRIGAGRDPDVRSADVVFYVQLEDRGWDIQVYRRNERNGSRRLDEDYVRALKDWFVAGGIPASDFPE